MDTGRYDVTLAVLNNARPFFQITNPGVKLVDLHIANVRKSLFAILKLAKQIRPSIILTTANHLNLYLAIFKWMFPKNIKIIARESSIVSVNTDRAPLPWLYHWLLRKFYKNIDLIICQSDYMRSDLAKNYKMPAEKMQIIYNAVAIPEVNTSDKTETSPAKLITVARLSKEKGIDRLIRAVSLLKIPYHFTIVGEGDQRAALQDQINASSLQQHISLAGGNEKPFTIVPNPDLFLMGSYYEGFPNAMLEAVAAGIPVVAFNAPGGIAELLVNNENGFLVPDDDVTAFAAAIEKALDHSFDKEKIKQITAQRFNINAVMQKWYKVFDGSR